MTARVEDVLLVDRCLSGEVEATRELFRRHRARVHGSLYRVLGSNQEIDDLIQEAFIQVFSSLCNWRAEASLATWIDRITVRVAFRYLRRKRGREAPLSLDDEGIGDVGEDGLRPCAASQQLAREGVRRLYAVLTKLSPAARIAFTLHELEGRPLAEIADLVGASVTATKVRVWRSRRSVEMAAAADPILREFLGEGGVG